MTRALAASAVGLTAGLTVGLWAGPVLAAQGAAQGPAQGPTLPQVPAPAADRGRLLYETHCIACHTTQMHWRDKRVVQDWASLLGQVGAWQARAKLGWNDADIRAVAAHLNASIYRLPDAPVRGE
ncbi:MAG: cytochrome c [Burkholderiaceae bacterium]|nr:cytochrome c [Rhodoferax sp.]MCP5284872.1 cytochrome c [Burkholderiaceae bacterium]